MKAKFCNKKKFNNIYFVILSIFFIIILFVFLFIKPRIILENDEIVLTLGSKYIEPSYYASNSFSNLTNSVKIKNNINILEVGNYKEIYEVKYGIIGTKKERMITIIDNEKPKIVLEGDSEINICPNASYQEIGYTVTDNYDKEIAKKIKIKRTDDKIIYSVSDSSNNKTKVIRKINKKDVDKPNISLIGSDVIYINVGNSYNEYGYTAIDNCDGDITSKVEIENNVNTNVVGTYAVNYKIVDSNNNSNSVTRTVKVISNSNNGVIYLTFDDGPSYDVTPNILNILKEEGVAATFFVINKDSSLDYLIQREYNEGHTIGLHSNSHNYAYIYSSADNYFNDLNSINNKVKSLIGIESKIIRFPGGSSNSVSKKYASHIMTDLVKEVGNRGYKYFDWNVDSKDAGGANSSESVYNNVVNSLVYNRTNVVLMHDFSGNNKTLNALRDIIRYGKNNGYTFDKISLSTPQITHNVSN